LLRAGDFDALLIPGHSGRKYVQKRFAAFCDLIVEALPREAQIQLGELHSTTLRSGEQRTSRQSRWDKTGVDVSFELAADPAEQIEVDLVGWEIHAADKFLRWLRSDDARRVLPTLTDHTLTIYSRKARSAKKDGKPYWMRPSGSDAETTPAPQVTNAWLDDSLLRFVGNEWEKPGIHLRRAWPRELLLGEPERVIAEMAAETERLLPVLRAANA
jgi:hypothetical protein